MMHKIVTSNLGWFLHRVFCVVFTGSYRKGWQKIDATLD